MVYEKKYTIYQISNALEHKGFSISIFSELKSSNDNVNLVFTMDVFSPVHSDIDDHEDYPLATVVQVVTGNEYNDRLTLRLGYYDEDNCFISTDATDKKNCKWLVEILMATRPFLSDRFEDLVK